MRVIVAGYGVGGAALSLALQRLGIDCIVLEQAHKLEEVGAGVQLSPNGVAVLKQLGVMEQLSRVAFEPHDMKYRDWKTGEVLLSSPLKPTVVEHFGSPYYHAHRADLLAVLREGLDASRISLGRKIVAVSQSADRVSVQLEDGAVEEGDVLIGADGIHSIVRMQMFHADAPESSGCIAWRGLVDVTAAERLEISPSGHFWMGPGYSAVIYYVSAGKKINWICIGNQPGGQQESWSATTTTREVLDIYKGWNPEVTGLIELTEKPFVTALYDRTPLETWVNGRTALLGDAAHAMLPYHAQGACQSIEDAWVLARLLDQGRDKPVQEVLHHYEELRRHRAQRVQAESRVAERRFHLSDPDEVEERNRRMRRYNTQYKGGFLPQQQWLFGYDAEAAALGTDDEWRALRPW